MSIKTEGAVPNDWVYVDIQGIDVGTYVQNAMHAVNDSHRRRTNQTAARLQPLLERPI